jgi:phosphohistidine phosphatase SixA
MDGAAAAHREDEPHRHRRLILARPGDAVGRRAWAGSVESRPLSDKGRRHVRRLGRFLAGRDVDVTTIASGPHERDRETADLLGASLGCRVMVERRLAGGLRLPGLTGLLDDLALRDDRPVERQRILLVVGEPVASMLLVLLTDSPGVDLAAGGAASLRLHGPIGPGCASLGWLVVPSMLRGLKGGGSRAKDRAAEREPVAV